MRYICSAFQKISRLGYGVMVTLQILVLSFMVRVRVAQQSTERLNSVPFFLCTFRSACLWQIGVRREPGAHLFTRARVTKCAVGKHFEHNMV